MEVQRAIVNIPIYEIERQLQFPPDWSIIGCKLDFDKNNIVLCVRGDSLPSTENGCLMPEAMGHITVTKDEFKKITKREINWEIKRR